MYQRTALRLSLLAGTALISFAAAQSAHAAGFYIQEQSVSAGGSAYAGAASNTKDASTVFFNPAGITKLDGAQANIGVQLLVPNGELKNTGSTFPNAATAISGGNGGNPYSPTPVPSGYAVMPVSGVEGLWLGVGVTAPFGLANKYDTDYFARFDSRRTELLTTDIQPTVAYQVNQWLSLGGGLNIQRAEATLTNAAFQGNAGTSKLEGDDWGVGYTLGAQIEVTPATTLGLNYRSSVHYNLEGKITVEDTTAPGSLTITDPASASLDTPDIASIGLSHHLTDKWTVMGQANWMGWNNFDNITPRNGAGVTPAGSAVEQNYQTVWSYALGAEYIYSPEWTFRGGIQYDNTPTTDEFRTTRTPDGDRTWFATGATYTFAPNMSLDLNLTYIDIAEETIDVSRNGGLARVRADTDGNVIIGGIGLNYKF